MGSRSKSVALTLPNGLTVRASTDGCLAEAQDKLYGDFRSWFRASVIVNNLQSEIQPKVVNDLRYQQALRAWAQCMGRSGHTARRPAELRKTFAELSSQYRADPSSGSRASFISSSPFLRRFSRPSVR